VIEPDAHRFEVRPGDPEPAGGWTRADLLRRATVGGAGLILLGGGYRQFAAEGASAAPKAESETVRQFFTRPDLRPPAVTVLSAPAGTARGLLFLAPSSGPGQRGAMILDNSGEIVWFRPSTPHTTMDFRAGIYKGRPVLSWWEGSHVRGVGKVGKYVIVDQSYREIARFSAGHKLRPDFHEFLLTPEGTAFVTAYDPVTADLSKAGGPKRGTAYDSVVQELDFSTGRVLFEWRSLKEVGVDESYQAQRASPFDYFHVNSIGFDDDGHLLISARNTWTIYKVHRRRGRVIWRLGGKKSDFAMGRGTSFAFQHDARSHDRGRLISLFDNGPHPKTKPQSRALVLELDTKRMRASLARQLVHAPPLFARVTGNTQILPNREMVVCWGSSGYFTHYDADGTALFDARLPKGGQNYRVFRLPWVGRPSAPPKLAARSTATGDDLYASWNGATEVTHWRLRAGKRPGGLQTGLTIPKQGFETIMRAPRGTRYASVVALDRSGKALGESGIISL
jgi:hypothetical protein